MKVDYYTVTGPMTPKAPDWRSFDDRVNALLRDGYELYGYPTTTTRGDEVIYTQAVVKYMKDKEQDEKNN